jgi:hypothetical protein
MGKLSSEFLVARPSFLEGVARILDFAGFMTEYNRSRTSEEADLHALRTDWAILGEDMRAAARATVKEWKASVPRV